MCDEAPDVVAAILTQLSMKAGLREWGKDAEKAVFDEMKQLHRSKDFCAKALASTEKGAESSSPGSASLPQAEN